MELETIATDASGIAQSHSHRMAALRRAHGEDSGWQSAKSEWTRTQILDATVRCFVRQGYSKTSTRDIARDAHVSRGALVHHFPTKQELLTAAIDHLHQQRVADFTTRIRAIPAQADHTVAGIDAYWEHLCSPLFAAVMELRIVARSDTELASVLRPSLSALEARWLGEVRKLFPEWSGAGDAFLLAMDLTQFLMEGMAVHFSDQGRAARYDVVRDYLKVRLKEMLAAPQASLNH